MEALLLLNKNVKYGFFCYFPNLILKWGSGGSPSLFMLLCRDCAGYGESEICAAGRLAVHYPYSCYSAGIVLATESLKVVLPGWRFTILLGDTECSSAQESLPFTTVTLIRFFLNSNLLTDRSDLRFFLGI